MKKIISTLKAPSAIGPYNQAVQANGMLFTSGQIAMDPETGELRTGDIATETQQVMRNLQAVLAEADCDFSSVVKVSIFLNDMNDFAAVNEVYANYFTDNYPARETVAVQTLPKNVNVEISMIAVVG